MSVYSSDSASCSPTTSGSAGAGFGLFDLDLFGDAGGQHGADDLVEIVEDGDVGGHLEVGDPEHVAHVERLDVQREVLGHVGRQGAHEDLAGDDVEQAAVEPDADRRALEGHRDVRLDGLGEVDLLKVDVRHEVLDLVDLVLLDDGDVRLGVALDHDVEHGVQAGAGGERVAQGVLFDGDAQGRRCPNRTGRPG